MQHSFGMKNIIALYVSDGVYYIHKTAIKYIPNKKNNNTESFIG